MAKFRRKNGMLVGYDAHSTSNTPSKLPKRGRRGAPRMSQRITGPGHGSPRTPRGRTTF